MALQRLGARCAFAAAVLTFSIALVAPRADAATAPISGVAVHPWRFEPDRLSFWPLRDATGRDRSFAALREAGVRRARVDLRWNVVEHHAKGVRDWSEFDAIHQSAALHGIQLLPTVAFTPGWASGSRDWWVPPRDASDYGDFVAAALERYPDIDVWEIWNEPNLPYFWRAPTGVAGFVELLRAANEARLRVGSPAKLVSGGLSSTGQDPFKWFDDMARLGAFAHVDGFGIHPYSRTYPPDHPKAFFGKVPEFRRRLVKLGREEVGIWVTEYGTPNTTVQTDYGPPISAEEQARNLGRAYSLASLWPWVHNLSWYELQEGCGASDKPDCRFGLFDHNFQPKPAFAQLRATLVGEITRLRSELTLHVRGRLLRGTLRKAGEQRATGVVRIRATDGGRVRSVKTSARDGSYSAKLGRLDRGTWRIVARFPGTRRHLSSESPVRIVSVP